MEIMLNAFDIEKSEVNYNKIDETYDFYLIKNEKEDFKPNGKIFDDVEFNKRILAIQYTGGNSFILMAKKSPDNQKLISDFIKKHNEENKDALVYEKLKVPFTKCPYSMIQIMFNALAKNGLEEGLSNLSGKLYYFSSKTSKQVFCIEIKICENYMVKLNGITFTEKSNNKQKQYVLTENNTMRLRNKNDKEGTFYSIGQYENTKHLTPFLSIIPAQFYESKMGIFSRVFAKFNKKYDGIVNLVMKKESDWNKVEVRSNESQKREHLRYIKKLLENKTINIVNAIKEESYLEIGNKFCSELKSQIENLFSSKYFKADDKELNFKVKIDKNLQKDDLNIMLVHNKNYYEHHPTEKDPYKITDLKVVQHITLEDFSKGKKLSVPKEKLCVVLINELIIKNDLASQDKQISIRDWTKYNFENNFTFCICKENWIEGLNEKKKFIGNDYIFMKIHPDGTFNIDIVSNEENCNIVNVETYKKVEAIFKKNDFNILGHNKSVEKYRAIVINDKNEINIIQDTELEMYPDFEKIAKDLQKGSISKSKESRSSYFLGSIDIMYKNYEKEALYSVGGIGDGMTGNMARVPNVRRIVPYENAPVFWKDLLDTMNVNFVRNGQLTVIPFPVKYMREFEVRNKAIKRLI